MHVCGKHGVLRFLMAFREYFAPLENYMDY